MWSEPIASPPDHGIPVRETKGQKLKPLLTLRISYFLSYASIIPFSLPSIPNFQGDPSPLQLTFFIFKLTVTNV